MPVMSPEDEARFAALSLREQFALLAPFAESDPEVAAWVESTERLLADNPLLGFEPHPAGEDGRRPQLEFIEARTPVVAAFAGNRFGKSTVLGMCALREALPREALPELLARTKRFDGPTRGWIMLPTEAKIEDSFRPVFEKWTPPSEFLGGSWGKAYNGASFTLRFKNGSTIAFKTYKQDASTLGGAALHWVGYDEPPPKGHREEGMMRLADHGGFEMFAMTPLSANTGYVRREIWKKRESPDITVVKGSIYDNRTLDRATVDRVLGSLSDVWRQAREFGDFVEVGGMIYPDFERSVLPHPPERRWSRTQRQRVRRQRDSRRQINDGKPVERREKEAKLAGPERRVGQRRVAERRQPERRAPERRHPPERWISGQRSVVVGIDPGIRNAAMVWVAFDRDNVATVFAEVLLQSKTPRDYAAAIKRMNALWGIKPGLVTYVVDPAARSRGQTNAETVQRALEKEGIPAYPGQNDVEAGIGQIRTRMEHGRIRVSPECRGLRDEADDYAAVEPAEGDDDSHLEPTKSNDHRLDALRYACMERFYDPGIEMSKPQQTLGWEPASGLAPPTSLVTGRRRVEYGPLGSFT